MQFLNDKNLKVNKMIGISWETRLSEWAKSQNSQTLLSRLDEIEQKTNEIIPLILNSQKAASDLTIVLRQTWKLHPVTGSRCYQLFKKIKQANETLGSKMHMDCVSSLTKDELDQIVCNMKYAFSYQIDQHTGSPEFFFDLLKSVEPYIKSTALLNNDDEIKRQFLELIEFVNRRALAWCMTDCTGPEELRYNQIRDLVHKLATNDLLMDFESTGKVLFGVLSLTDTRSQITLWETFLKKPVKLASWKQQFYSENGRYLTRKFKMEAKGEFAKAKEVVGKLYQDFYSQMIVNSAAILSIISKDTVALANVQQILSTTAARIIEKKYLYGDTIKHFITLVPLFRPAINHALVNMAFDQVTNKT